MIPISKPVILEEEKRAVLEVLDSGMLAQGKAVSEFEEAFSSYLGAEFAVATSSGTTALCLALQACRVEFGDKVLTTPFTFIATANAILYCGAEPVFCDIDPETFNISPRAIRDVLSIVRGIKALLVVHLFGLPCAMDEIVAIARENNLLLIEDCAQAHGAAYKGKNVGCFGNAGAFSFYATKNMTCGEGGMVVTSNAEVARHVRLLRDHGQSEEYDHHILGYNYRMTNIQAIIGICQLKRLEEMNHKRIANAGFLRDHLQDLGWLSLPHVSEDAGHVFHQFTLRVREDRDTFARYLRQNGVGCKIYYPRTVYAQPLYEKLGFVKISCPEAERASREVLSIPVHPGLSAEELERIVRIIRNYDPRRLQVKS